jgi:hypothetical protein
MLYGPRNAQPLIEISTRKIYCGKWRSAVKAYNPTAIFVSRFSRKYGILVAWKAYRFPRPVSWITLLLIYLFLSLVRTGTKSTRIEATKWHIVQPWVMNDDERWVCGMVDRGNWTTRRKPGLAPHCHHKYYVTWFGLEPESPLWESSD